MEWIVAVGAFLLVCALVIGWPLYAAMTRWSTREQRRAAEQRRRASATALTGGAAATPSAPAGPARRRRVLSP